MPSDEQDLSTVPHLDGYLANTPFVSDLITPLSGGFANFIFRLHLRTPYKGHSTLVLKHGKAFVIASGNKIPFGLERQVFEVEALNRVRAWLPVDSVVAVPEVHRFDKDANIIIMDDCGENAITLKQLMQENPPSLPLANKLGTAIGTFLGQVHAWGRQDASVIDLFDTNQQGKAISAWVTYGRLVTTLTGQDDLPALSDPPLSISESNLNVITELASKRTAEITSSCKSFVQGDFWPGNVMITLKPGSDDVERIHILDWELAKGGLPGMDVGQFCAEMHLLRRFNPLCNDAASGTITTFLESYAHACSPDASLFRLSIVHLGGHLVVLTPRIPWGSKEQTRHVVKEGVELIVDGLTGSDDWLKSSIVGPLVRG